MILFFSRRQLFIASTSETNIFLYPLLLYFVFGQESLSLSFILSHLVKYNLDDEVEKEKSKEREDMMLPRKWSWRSSSLYCVLPSLFLSLLRVASHTVIICDFFPVSHLYSNVSTACLFIVVKEWEATTEGDDGSFLQEDSSPSFLVFPGFR